MKKLKIPMIATCRISSFRHSYQKNRNEKKKKTKLFDELSCDEIIGETSNDKFRINFFTVIMDNVINNIEYRFNAHKELYLDLQFFNPRRLKNIDKTLSEKYQSSFLQ